jgi:hypothetical protein
LIEEEYGEYQTEEEITDLGIKHLKQACRIWGSSEVLLYED